MLLAYIDETDNKSTYYVVSMLVRDSDLIPLGKSIDELRLEISHEYGLSRKIEFHGYDILNGEKDWHLLKNNYQAQIDVYGRIMKCILAHEIRVYVRGIEIDAFVKRYGSDRTTIHNAALIWNLEKIQNKAQACGEVVLAIADDVGKESSFYRANLRHHQEFETFGWDPVILDRIVDTIHFAPSKESSFIQAVDVLAHAVIRAKRKDTHPVEIAFNKELWNMLITSKRVMYFGTW